MAGNRGNGKRSIDDKEVAKNGCSPSDIERIFKRLEKLDALEAEVLELKTQLKEKDERITFLERRVDEVKEQGELITSLEGRIEDLEQYTRKEDVIITGIQIDRKYAEVAAAAAAQAKNDKEKNSGKDKKGKQKNDAEQQSNVAVELNNIVEDQVIEFLNSKGVYIKKDEIAACHTLGKPTNNGLQKIIMRFANRRSKAKVMITAKKLKGTGVFINEHLTRRTAEIAKAARDLRREGKILSTFTRDCKVIVKKNDEKYVTVKDLADLSVF
jgi:hypothetical protein